MYWVLSHERVTDDEGGFLAIDDALDLPGIDRDEWARGHLLSLQWPESVVLAAYPRNDYRGPPPDFLDVRSCLMSEKMMGVLRKNGVDNVEAHPVVVTNGVTHESLPYSIVNVVGLLAVADMEKSVYDDGGDNLRGDTRFSSLVIIEKHCHEFRMFRLAQNRDTILVSDRLRLALEAAGLLGLKFFELGEWRT